MRTVIVSLILLALAGCATGGASGLSSLSREVKLTPTNGQSVDQARADDAECVTWTRATKGKDEPLPNAELRYAACVVARGYQAQVCCVPAAYIVSSPTARTLDQVIADWRACRMDKTDVNPWTAVPFSDAARGRNALECLKGRGYSVE